jgi:hypothetical protein
MLVNMLSTFCHIRMLFSHWLPFSDVVLSYWSMLCYSSKLDSVSLSWLQIRKHLAFLTYFWALVLALAEASAESLESILKYTHPLYLLLGLGLGPGCGIS